MYTNRLVTETEGRLLGKYITCADNRKEGEERTDKYSCHIYFMKGKAQ
jgi:hypothetical protein